MKLIHFVLDETSSLGHLDALDDAIDKYRAYGVRLQMYFQSPAQAKKCFPDGQEVTLLSNTSQIYFGVNDNATAEYVSVRLGEQTIVVDSGGTSSGNSSQSASSVQSQPTRGWSSNASHNWQQQTRKLLKPEEVMSLPARTAITFVPGMPPIQTTLVRYYEEWNLGSPGRIRRAIETCCHLAASVTICVLLLLLAVVATLIAMGEKASSPFTPRWQDHSGAIPIRDPNHHSNP